MPDSNEEKRKAKYFCGDENCFICKTGGFHISFREIVFWTVFFGLILFFAN